MFREEGGNFLDSLDSIGCSVNSRLRLSFVSATLWERNVKTPESWLIREIKLFPLEN